MHYSQVKLVVDALERMNEKPLVIMPQKYTAPKFNVNYGLMQELSDRDLAVLKEYVQNTIHTFSWHFLYQYILMTALSLLLLKVK